MKKWVQVRSKLLSDPDVAKEHARLPSVQIASEIIKARQGKGLTQVELARLTGTSQSAISRLERGNYEGYTLKTLNKIASVLEKSLEFSFRPLHGRRGGCGLSA